jgi:transposase
VDAICQRTSGALAEPYAELREAVKDAPVICVDETGWRRAGERRTLWGALTDGCAAFHIAADRHEREPPELIGESFAGIVSSDRWWAYDQLDPARRQVCWAHLLRDFRHHAEGLADQQRFGEAGLEVCRALFAAWDAFASHGDRDRLAREIAPTKRRLRALLEPHRKKSVRNRRFRTFARNLLKLWPALWTFVEVDGVEPTNNRAERGLRGGDLPQGLARQPVRAGGALRRTDALGLPDLPAATPLTLRLPGRGDHRHLSGEPRALAGLTQIEPTAAG